jgi:hypothetical protein
MGPLLQDLVGSGYALGIGNKYLNGKGVPWVNVKVKPGFLIGYKINGQVITVWCESHVD